MCAGCHNTRLRKNYNPLTDTYATAMAEMTVGCEACHGPGVAGAAAMQEALDRGGHVGKVRRGEKRPPILNFGLKSDEPV